jgi:transcriptional regulator GlxA family with amidase domain
MLVDWLARRLSDTRRVSTVCTGIYALAPTGALDGCEATTHWRFLGDVARKFPAITLVGARVFVGDGHLYTSGGVASGVDLALALVAEDLGTRLASQVAEHMVLHVIRGGQQRQVSTAMRSQTQAADRLGDLLAWIAANLGERLDVERLAERAALSPRQLHRLFVAKLGVSPAQYVEQARIEEARNLLAERRMSVRAVAAATGYASADSFRRAFARRFGEPPSRIR